MNLVFNGDDILVFYYNGVVIDCFGIVGERLSIGWGSVVIVNSFKCILLSNNVFSMGIDVIVLFDLVLVWEKWLD